MSEVPTALDCSRLGLGHGAMTPFVGALEEHPMPDTHDHSLLSRGSGELLVSVTLHGHRPVNYKGSIPNPSCYGRKATRVLGYVSRWNDRLQLTWGSDALCSL